MVVSRDGDDEPPPGPAPQRGRYLKLSETGSKRPRSTVLLPGAGIKWVHSLIDYYIGECAAGCDLRAELTDSRF
jgi:hypothetical protein